MTQSHNTPYGAPGPYSSSPGGAQQGAHAPGGAPQGAHAPAGAYAPGGTPPGTPSFQPGTVTPQQRSLVRKLGTAMLILSIVIVLIRVFVPGTVIAAAAAGVGLASSTDGASFGILGIGLLLAGVLSIIGLILAFALTVVGIVAAIQARASARVAAIIVAAAPAVFWVLGMIVSVIINIATGVSDSSEPGAVAGIATGVGFAGGIATLVLALLFAVVVIGGSIRVRSWGKAPQA